MTFVGDYWFGLIEISQRRSWEEYSSRNEGENLSLSSLPCMRHRFSSISESTSAQWSSVHDWKLAWLIFVIENFPPTLKSAHPFICIFLCWSVVTILCYHSPINFFLTTHIHTHTHTHTHTHMRATITPCCSTTVQFDSGASIFKEDYKQTQLHLTWLVMTILDMWFLRQLLGFTVHWLLCLCRPIQFTSWFTIVFLSLMLFNHLKNLQKIAYEI
jgi:hypothetical protein